MNEALRVLKKADQFSLNVIMITMIAGTSAHHMATTGKNGASPARKRYRREPEKTGSDDEWKSGSDLDQPSGSRDLYVPVKERRKQRLIKLGRISELKNEDERSSSRMMESLSSGGASSEDDLVNKGAASAVAGGGHRKQASKMAAPTVEEIIRREEEILAKNKDVSLLLQHSKLKKLAEAKYESEMDKQLQEEERILKSVAENTALMSAAELAKGERRVDSP